MEEDWLALYGQATAEDIAAELEMLQEELARQTEPYYEQLFEEQRYTIAGHHAPGVQFAIEVGDELCEYRFLPDGNVAKAVLAESDHPEPYRLKHQIDWLVERTAVLEGTAPTVDLPAEPEAATR